MIRQKDDSQMPVIDLTGPQGNAFFLLGYASNLAKKLGKTPSEIVDLTERMKESDYENLIQVFDETFGDYVILER